MPKYRLLYKDKNFLVVYKPAGLITHQTVNIKEDSLAEQLLQDFPKIKKVGEDPFRPGIVHRLDKYVSGVMVVARNNNSFDHLKNIFKKRMVEKTYLALVHGEIIKDEDEIDFPISRSSRGYKMAALPSTVKGQSNRAGRYAYTKFEIIKRFFHFTLLKVQIKTGRTHQIRVHLAAYGHPVVGDDLYGNKKSKTKNKKINMERIWLHAEQLSFAGMDGKIITFSTPLPNELKKILMNLKPKL